MEPFSSSVNVSTPLAHVGKLLCGSLLHLVLLVLQFCAGVPGGGCWWRPCNGQGIGGPLAQALTVESPYLNKAVF